jgi:hypothetical protein
MSARDALRAHRGRGVYVMGVAPPASRRLQRTWPRGIALLLWLASAAARAQDAEAAENGVNGVPIVAYLPETGLLLGGYAVYHFRFAGQSTAEPASTLPVIAAVTTKKELGIELDPELFLPDKTYWLYGEATARFVPKTSYFGLGNATRNDDEEGYQSIVLGLDTEWRRRLVGGLYVGVFQTLQYRSVQDVDPDGLLAADRPPGFEGGISSGLGPELFYDTRDNAYAPRRGSLLSLSLPFFGPTTGSEFRFTRITFDARTYLPLGGRHVLALRGLWDAVIGTAPFDRGPEIGSSSAMRGYVRGRFRDAQALSFEVEWRFPIYWRFGGAAFVGAGRVADRLTDMGWSGFHLAGGIGVRFALVPEERINLRLDVAAAPDAVHPYLAPGEAY